MVRQRARAALAHHSSSSANIGYKILYFTKIQYVCMQNCNVTFSIFRQNSNYTFPVVSNVITHTNPFSNLQYVCNFPRSVILFIYLSYFFLGGGGTKLAICARHIVLHIIRIVMNALQICLFYFFPLLIDSSSGTTGIDATE